MIKSQSSFSGPLCCDLRHSIAGILTNDRRLSSTRSSFYESEFTRIRSYIALAPQKKSAFLLGAQQTLIPSLIRSQLPNAVRWSLFGTLEGEIGQENLILGCRRVSFPLWDVLDPEGMWVPVLGKECGSWSEFERMISQLGKVVPLGICYAQDHC